VPGKKLALVAIPVAVAAVAIALIFAFPSPQDNAGTEPEDNGSVIPASATEECSAINRRVQSIAAYGIGQPTEATMSAADRLVEEYCQRPELVQEIGLMSNPALGLVAYGCEAGSGEVGDAELKEALAEHSQTYCDSGLVVILEDAELLSVTAADYRDNLLNEEDTGEDPDIGTNSTANSEEVREKLQEATAFANKAKSLAYDGHYYEAVKSLDSGIKLLESLSQA
jgi:hypothetical protein